MSIADELITRGRSVGRPVGKDGSVCLYAAAAFAYGLTPDICVFIQMGRQMPEVWRVLHRLCGDRHPDTLTDDEVLRVAKQADEILNRGASE